MKGNQAAFPVKAMCRMLGLSTSGYYAWLTRPPSKRSRSNEVLLRRIREIHRFSRQTYGRPRIYAELRDDGVLVNHKRVARLMSRNGIVGATRRRKWRTTKRDRNARPAPDLIERDFTATGPDQLWVADITYVPTSAVFLFLAVVVDAWSRRIVGWSMETHLRTELVLQALNMALWQRRPEQVIHHSDQGTQYTSIAFERDPEKGVIEFRKHLGWHTKGLPGGAKLRQRLFEVRTLREVEALLEGYLETSLDPRTHPHGPGYEVTR